MYRLLLSHDQEAIVLKTCGPGYITSSNSSATSSDKGSYSHVVRVAVAVRKLLPAPPFGAVTPIVRPNDGLLTARPND